MRLNWKSVQLAMLVLLAAGGWSGAGCSGINANGSVSPATFFLPGVRNTVPAAPDAPVFASVSAPEIARVQ